MCMCSRHAPLEGSCLKLEQQRNHKCLDVSITKKERPKLPQCFLPSTTHIMFKQIPDKRAKGHMNPKAILNSNGMALLRTKRHSAPILRRQPGPASHTAKRGMLDLQLCLPLRRRASLFPNKGNLFMLLLQSPAKTCSASTLGSFPSIRTRKTWAWIKPGNRIAVKTQATSTNRRDSRPPLAPPPARSSSQDLSRAPRACCRRRGPVPLGRRPPGPRFRWPR